MRWIAFYFLVILSFSAEARKKSIKGAAARDYQWVLTIRGQNPTNKWERRLDAGSKGKRFKGVGNGFSCLVSDPQYGGATVTRVLSCWDPKNEHRKSLTCQSGGIGRRTRLLFATTDGTEALEATLACVVPGKI